MLRPFKAFAATLTAFALVTATAATPAFAGQKNHYGKGYGYKSGYHKGYHKGAHRGYNRGYRHASRHHYKPRHHYRPKHHYRQGHHYRGYYNHHGGHHRHGLGKTGAAILGVGLGLTTAAIIANSRRDRVYDNRVYVAPQPVRPLAEPAYNPNAAPGYTNAQNFNNCLQTREYQSVVIIGGQEQEAYGTACLQPDGSWLRGPAQVAPQY